MAAKYCLNCGYKNETSGGMPKKCAKCQTDFQSMAKDIIRIYKKDEDKVIDLTNDENELEQVEGSEFDSFMDEEPESITQDEIQKIFLANTNRGFNLRDFMQQELKKIEHTTASTKKSTPKTKGTRKKSK